MIVDKIKKILKKKNEKILVDLYLKDYDKSNFYFALVYSKTIRKYKMLFVPIDAIENEKNISEYFCYQFIFAEAVDYLLDSLSESISLDEDENRRLKANTKMNAYYIEMNILIKDSYCKFTFSQYIDKEFAYLFEIVVSLFEYAPNIVSELGKKILLAFNEGQDAVKYTDSYDFDLFHGNLEDLFQKEIINHCSYDFEDIQFIENVGSKYYAVINQHLFIVDYQKGKKILNVVSDDLEPLGEEIYIFIKAIRAGLEKEFYRLMVVEEKEDFDSNDDFVSYYLCYGVDGDDFLVANSSVNNRLSLDTLRHECVKIRNFDSELKNQLEAYLKEKYEDNRVKELLDFSFIK